MRREWGALKIELAAELRKQMALSMGWIANSMRVREECLECAEGRVEEGMMSALK